jgi:hypothetical protein
MSESEDRSAGTCARCVHFDDDPSRFEAAFPGLTILSSGFGDSRGTTGLCLEHERLAQPWDTCEDFSPRQGRCPEPVEGPLP